MFLAHLWVTEICRSSGAGVLGPTVFYKYVAVMRLVASFWGFAAKQSEPIYQAWADHLAEARSEWPGFSVCENRLEWCRSSA